MNDKEIEEIEEEFAERFFAQREMWKKQIWEEYEKEKLKIEEQKKSKGLGDTIKKVTDFLHIPQCGGCKDRQKKLNQLFPYK